MGEQYSFDAFISYRHTELDKFVAENLHKQLESFRLPKNIAKSRKGEKTKIERVFRDKEELPLTSDLNEPIMKALHNSEWLIVICSPRLRESLWCKKEIETFVKLRGRERVLAVLIEGEPSESFPDELLFRVETRVLPNGTKEEVKIPVEPLAADVRGKSKKEILKAMKTEVLRLYAAMFSLNYDDLRQRHKEQKMKRILTASLIGGAACLAFGVYSTATALRISGQNKQIEAQSTEILAQSEQIKLQNEELAYNQALLLADLSRQYMKAGDRESARKTAMMSLTEHQGVPMPTTAEGQMVLLNSMRVYDIGEVYKIEYQIQTVGVIQSLAQSPDGDILAICDDAKMFYLYDLCSREMLEVQGTERNEVTLREHYDFLGEDYLVYRSAYEEYMTRASVYDIQKQEVVAELETQGAGTIVCSEDGKWIVVRDYSSNYIIFDGNTFEKKGQIDKVPGTLLGYTMKVSEDGILSFATYEFTQNNTTEYKMYFVDINANQIVSSYAVEDMNIVDVKCYNEIAYIAATKWAPNTSDYSDAYLTAVDIRTGKELWKKEHKGFAAKSINLPINEGATDLLFLTETTATLYNLESGVCTVTLPISSEVLCVKAFENENTYRMFCKDAEILNISTQHKEMINTSHRIECMTIDNEAAEYTEHGIVILPEVGNHIVVYTQEIGPDVVATDVSPELPENIYANIDDGMDEEAIARMYGLDNPKLVKRVMYSDDGTICFLFYTNKDMVVYNVEEDVVVNTIPNMPLLEWYIGRDENDCTYIYGYAGCYVLDAEMKPIMYIDNVRHIDIENRKVYLSWYEHVYEAPLYTLDELLEIAGEFEK